MRTVWGLISCAIGLTEHLCGSSIHKVHYLVVLQGLPSRVKSFEWCITSSRPASGLSPSEFWKWNTRVTERVHGHIGHPKYPKVMFRTLSWLGGRQPTGCPHDLPTPVSSPEPNPDHAWKTLALMNEWIRHSDAKAGVTLAFTGVMATMLFNLAKDFTPRTVVFDFLVVVACLLLICTGTLCGWTLTPRLKDTDADRDAINSLFFASIDQHFRGKRQEYSEVLQTLTADPVELTKDLADQVHANARIATVKATAAKRAIRCALATGATIAILALVIGVTNS